jgi:Ca2+/Na+ antiporter
MPSLIRATLRHYAATLATRAQRWYARKLGARILRRACEVGDDEGKRIGTALIAFGNGAPDHVVSMAALGYEARWGEGGTREEMVS